MDQECKFRPKLIEGSKLELEKINNTNSMKKKESISIEKVNEKNAGIAPGLTIVCWSNESVELIKLYKKTKRDFSGFQNYIWWYSKDHLHLTLSALIRTKYGEFLPLKARNLPKNIADIISETSKIKPFCVEITKHALRSDGQIQLIGEVDKKNQKSLSLFRALTYKIDPRFQYLDAPKSEKPERFHINIGYFKIFPEKPIQPFIKDLKIKIKINITNISIVHYLKRTLENKYIVGQVHVPLGQELKIPYKLFTNMLGLNQ